MRYPVTKVVVTITFDTQTETGLHDFTFDFVPKVDDPLILALLKRHEELLLARLREEPPGNFSL